MDGRKMKMMEANKWSASCGRVWARESWNRVLAISTNQIQPLWFSKMGEMGENLKYLLRIWIQKRDLFATKFAILDIQKKLKGWHAGDMYRPVQYTSLGVGYLINRVHFDLWKHIDPYRQTWHSDVACHFVLVSCFVVHLKLTLPF